MATYNTVLEIYGRNYGSEKLYKRGNCNNLVYTEGVMDFQQSLNAFWVVDNVISYMPAVFDGYMTYEYNFYVVEIVVNQDNKGTMEVFTEGYIDETYNDHISIIKQDIPFIDLPTMIDAETTTYKFYLELSAVAPVTFTLLLPSEH